MTQKQQLPDGKVEELQKEALFLLSIGYGATDAMIKLHDRHKIKWEVADKIIFKVQSNFPF